MYIYAWFPLVVSIPMNESKFVDEGYEVYQVWCCHLASGGNDMKLKESCDCYYSVMRISHKS